MAGIGAARPVTLRQLTAKDFSLGQIPASVQKGKDAVLGKSPLFQLLGYAGSEWQQRPSHASCLAGTIR